MAASVFIVLFRGVGGETKLPSAPLRDALTKAGFAKVTTYIATGNVVLASELSADGVRDRVAAIARRELSFEKAVIVATRQEWTTLIRQNPFPEATAVPRTLHAFLLDGKPKPAQAEALQARAQAGERVALKGRFLYVHTPEGFGVSKLPPFVERLLGVSATARNWNTVLKLKELADEAAK
jgi:uncharacterized protein (DUF1697 family)